MLKKCLDDCGVTALVTGNTTAQAPELVPERENPTYYFWGGKMARLPQYFDFPSGCPRIAWQYWCCGDPFKGYLPLKYVQPQDIYNLKARRRLSDFRFLMKLVEEEATRLGIMKSNPTVEEAIEIFERCKYAVEVDDESLQHRKRRVAQLAWITVATELRKKVRVHI